MSGGCRATPRCPLQPGEEAEVASEAWAETGPRVSSVRGGQAPGCPPPCLVPGAGSACLSPEAPREAGRCRRCGRPAVGSVSPVDTGRHAHRALPWPWVPLGRGRRPRRASLSVFEPRGLCPPPQVLPEAEAVPSGPAGEDGAGRQPHARPAGEHCPPVPPAPGVQEPNREAAGSLGVQCPRQGAPLPPRSQG